jgi:cytochrome c biogenesis protein CcmG, thiol:disulfide interchange protein DsbE
MLSNAPSRAASTGQQTHVDRQRRSRLLLLLPLVLFFGLVLALAVRLDRDPSKISIDATDDRVQPPAREGARARASNLDLTGEVSLVNVFASWCVACREQHSLLMQLKADGVVAIDGLNYKDEPDNAARWLNSMGDPYTRTGADRDGRVAIDWGVYGVPETFVITKDGRIAHKQIGPLTTKDLEDTVLTFVRKL